MDGCPQAPPGEYWGPRMTTPTQPPSSAPPRESDAELQALLAAINDVILVLDADGRYVKIAPTNPSVLGRPAPELLGKTLHDVFEKARADEFLASIRDALATRHTVHVEYRLKINGRDVWFTAAISPLGDDRVVWVVRDITEGRGAAERLRASEERFRALVEHSSDIITLLGRDGTVLYASESTAPVLGYGSTANLARNP